MTANKPKLNGFEFLERLGRGAFGEVWKARDRTADNLRAIKIVAREILREQDVRRLIAEAQTMARLPNHRNRVVIHQIKDGITNCFLVMDYVRGGPLDRLTAPEQPMPWPRAVRYIAGVGDGLLEVHERGLLHRDIKPANILLDPDRDEAVLGDFGLTVSVDLAGRGAGTRGYAAPEAYRGAATVRSDIFSLAASLLHLVTGERPRENVRPTDHAKWASLPGELQQVIDRGLEPDPDRRPDLPAFLALLREARWKALTDRMLAAVPDTPVRVKLQASVAVARPDRPEAFRPLVRDGHVLPAATGDFVKVEARADADGFLTVLVLESSGELEVGLPCPTEPENRFGAGQRCSLIFRLTPPAGTERLLIHWSAEEVRRTPMQWREWLERVGLSPGRTEPGNAEGRVRGAEVVRVSIGPAAEGQRRLLVIPVPHVTPP
ncbi:MAG TPA: protein kinase [Gemmataceae bacterium]|nr:protein kinase [Gemmataceae bacterium]